MTIPASASVALTAHTAASVTELLAMTEEFLRTAGPLVHAELRDYLAHRCPPADPAWFIDMLGFTGSHLHHLLPPDTAPPSENWQPAHQNPAHQNKETHR